MYICGKGREAENKLEFLLLRMILVNVGFNWTKQLRSVVHRLGCKGAVTE